MPALTAPVSTDPVPPTAVSDADVSPAADAPHSSDRPAVSLVGRALLELDESVEQMRAGEDRSRDLLRLWEERWQGSQTRIVERLRVIDEQLGSTGTTAANTCPRLGLIGVPADAGEMAPMVG